MSYSEIRAYFNQEIKKVDSDLKEWREALVFNDAQNIPATLLDTRYHIEMGAISSTPAQDLSVEDTATVKVTVLKNGTNEPTSALDQILDIAHSIRHQLINPINVESFGGAIELVENTSITPSELDTSNDNVIQVQLEFNVRMFFCVT